MQRAAVELPGIKELLKVHQRSHQVLQQLSLVAREDWVIVSTHSDGTS